MSRIYKPRTFLTPELKRKIVDFYKQGNNKLKCCSEFNVCDASVDKSLKEFYPNRPRRRKYYFNERYFENIDTEAKAYFLGLMVADGTVRPDGTVSIGLQGSDIYILEKLKEEVEFTGNLRMTVMKSGKDFGTLFLCSPIMAKDLAKYGCIPKKSHFTYFPDIPDNLQHHFIRGVFDGDGWCCVNDTTSPVFGVIGNIDLIGRIQDILVQKCNLENKTKLRTDKRNNTPNIVSLCFGGRRNLRRIRNYLYQDATFFLTRKKEKMDSIIPFEPPAKPRCALCDRISTSV